MMTPLNNIQFKEITKKVFVRQFSTDCESVRGKSRLEVWIKAVGSFCFFFGSLLFATTNWAGNSPKTFLLFGVGHLLWGIAGILMRDRSVLLLNSMYIFFDTLAISIRL